MKRTLFMSLVLSLVVAGLVAPAEAGKKKKKPKRIERKAETTYQAPAIGIGELGTGVCFVPTNSCGNVPTGPKDLWVKIQVEDASTTNVMFSVGQDTDPDALGTETDLGTFCGGTEEAIPVVSPGHEIVLFPWAVGGPSCPGIATTGTVTLTFSNLP
jgi:hypothetical protein